MFGKILRKDPTWSGKTTHSVEKKLELSRQESLIVRQHILLTWITIDLRAAFKWAFTKRTKSNLEMFAAISRWWIVHSFNNILSHEVIKNLLRYFMTDILILQRFNNSLIIKDKMLVKQDASHIFLSGIYSN